MSQSASPAGPATPAGGGGKAALVSVKWLLRAACVAAVVFAVAAASQLRSALQSEADTAAQTVRTSGLVAAEPKSLARQFTDSHGRLLADPPTDSSALQDPTPIVLAHIISEDRDPESADISWPAFDTYLSAAIGRPVTDELFDNSPEQLATVKQNAITLVALHAADVPYLVNNEGFQPVAVLGNDGGANGNKLDIIVPANSPINTLAQIKDHALTCTVPSSITGYRAAIALLMQIDDLRPNVDYTVTWSLKQKASIAGVAKGQYEAAAVSDDSLQAQLAAGAIDKSQFKSIYQSDVIPRTTIGYFYNLQPGLADKLRAAIVGYPGATADAAAKPLRFLPVDYKKDFALVRSIDDQFDPRFNAKAAKPATTTAPTTAADLSGAIP